MGTQGKEMTGRPTDMASEEEWLDGGQADVREAEEEGLDELYGGDAVETAGEGPASEDEEAEVLIVEIA